MSRSTASRISFTPGGPSTNHALKTKILVVGQTPPPLGGQAIMIEKMLAGDYGARIELCHVRMGFSKDMDEIGKVRLGKIGELFSVIFGIIRGRFKHGARILYYPPAGPNKVPMLRDMAILIPTRWLFKKTVFHFHACGLSELYDDLSPPLRLLFRLAYFRPDVAMRLSPHNPEDGQGLKAKQEVMVPNGIEDAAEVYPDLQASPKREVPHLLFVGVLCESKGVRVLLEACKLLQEKHLAFHLEFMGRFESPQFEKRVRDELEEYGLTSNVTFLGQLKGREKYEAFAEADIFCYPTFFESESFGLVAAEAMSFSLPVVATRWRGVQSVVDEGQTGFLVTIRDAAALADRIEKLIRDPQLRETMGQAGRKRYLEQFTIDKFQERLKNVFETLAVDVEEDTREASYHRG